MAGGVLGAREGSEGADGADGHIDELRVLGQASQQRLNAANLPQAHGYANMQPCTLTLTNSA